MIMAFTSFARAQIIMVPEFAPGKLAVISGSSGVDQRQRIEGDNAALRQYRNSAAFVTQMPPSLHSRYILSPRSAVKPIGRRLATGGCMSWRIRQVLSMLAAAGL